MTHWSWKRILLAAALSVASGSHVWAADQPPSGTVSAAGEAVANSTDNSQTKSKDDAVKSQIDAMVTERVQQLAIPGYAIGIMKDGKVFFQKGYGLADLDKPKEAVTPDTIFGLASVTKTFTAMTLLRLVDQGKVNIDDTIDKYLDHLPDAWKKLTIRQLANMSAGIPESRPGEVGWGEEMKIVEDKPLLFEAGTSTKYSNPSYRTLGSIIEKVTGKPYLEAVLETICKPL